MGESKSELVVYERDDIMVSITDSGVVVVTEKDESGHYRTDALRIDGKPPTFTVDGPTWVDAAKGHKAMIQNIN